MIEKTFLPKLFKCNKTPITFYNNQKMETNKNNF